jgi:hypothetical protein
MTAELFVQFVSLCPSVCLSVTAFALLSSSAFFTHSFPCFIPSPSLLYSFPFLALFLPFPPHIKLQHSYYLLIYALFLPVFFLICISFHFPIFLRVFLLTDLYVYLRPFPSSHLFNSEAVQKEGLRNKMHSCLLSVTIRSVIF